VVLCYNQSLQNAGIDSVIEARVAQEFRERYRNTPRFEIKYGTVVVTKDEIVEERVGE